MAEIAAIGDLAHELESLFERLADGRLYPRESLPVCCLPVATDWQEWSRTSPPPSTPVSPQNELVKQVAQYIKGRLLRVQAWCRASRWKKTSNCLRPKTSRTVFLYRKAISYRRLRTIMTPNWWKFFPKKRSTSSTTPVICWTVGGRIFRIGLHQRAAARVTHTLNLALGWQNLRPLVICLMRWKMSSNGWWMAVLTGSNTRSIVFEVP